MKAKLGKRRHAWRFKIELPDGQVKILKSMSKVYYGASPVELTLTAADVRRSMDLEGVGNTSTCSMAVCTTRQKDAFRHSVVGFIDWFYSYAFVASKLSKATGLPVACYAYQHNDDIARLNDTKGGQRKLLELLEKNGPITIKLNPIDLKAVRRNNENRKPPGKVSGTPHSQRKPRILGHGANLRAAVAQLGGVG